ncbi:MAG: acyltransferase family protein [Mucilaginibacter sp.]
MTEKPSQSLVSIDIARAVAALGVFYYHQQLGSVIAHYSGLKWFAYTDAFGATYAVPLFFLISGYCIHLSNIKYVRSKQPLPIGEYYKRRLLRIYPPYAVAVIFSVAANYIINRADHIPKNDFFVHLLLLQGFTINYFSSINIVLWTISIELAFYILYPIFYYLRLRFSLNYALACTFVVSCISIVYFFTKTDISLYQRYCVFNLWFAWCCGAYLADKKVLNTDDLKKSIYKIVYGVIFVAFFALKIVNQPKLAIIDYQLNILIWTAPLMFLLSNEKWFSYRKSIFFKALAAIGLSSYSLYLFHEPLIAIKNFAVHELLPAKLQSIGVFVGFLIIPVITWFSYKYIEKPFMVKKRKSLVSA